MSGITGAARPVVTLWETHGSGMAEIAAALAENLDVPLHSGAFSSEDLVGAAARGEDTRSGWYLVQATGRPGKRFRWGHLIDGTRKANAEIAAETTAEIRQLACDGGVFQGKNATFILQALVDSSYDRFLSLVAEGRKMSKDALRPPASGPALAGSGRHFGQILAAKYALTLLNN